MVEQAGRLADRQFRAKDSPEEALAAPAGAVAAALDKLAHRVPAETAETARHRASLEPARLTAAAAVDRPVVTEAGVAEEAARVRTIAFLALPERHTPAAAAVADRLLERVGLEALVW